MKLFSHYRVGSSLLMLVVVVAVLGSSCGEIVEIGIDHAVEIFRQRHDFKGTVRLSDDQKRITSVVGKGTKVYRGTAGEMASQFLKENRDLFGLAAGLADLRLLMEKSRQFGANVEFQQIFNGLPVENARIQINFDKDGRVVQVLSSYTPPEGAVDQANVSKERATEIVINEFLRTTPYNLSKREQQENVSGTIASRDQLDLKEAKVDDIFFSTKGRLHRAYRVSISAVRPFGIKQFVTDASSGEILHTRTFISNAVEGHGQVFIPNPVNSLNDNSLRDVNDLTVMVPNNNPNPYFTVRLRDLEVSAGRFTLRGPFVVLEDIEAPSNTLSGQIDVDGFNFNRTADDFEEVMLYYHIDRMQRYIQTELNFTNIMNRPISVDAHGLKDLDNSHYVAAPGAPGHGYLAFGDVGVDDAEDADVIAHEYGHAIQDDQAPHRFTGIGAPKAMGEGFGDYWAFSTYYSETLASTHDPGCLMEWDQVPRCLRRIDDGPPASSFDPARTEHINGPIWSRTLFEIFTRLGKKTADQLILQSHFNISGYNPSFWDGANAIIAADEQLSRANVFASNKATLCQIFIERGIYNATDCSP